MTGPNPLLEVQHFSDVFTNFITKMEEEITKMEEEMTKREQELTKREQNMAKLKKANVSLRGKLWYSNNREYKKKYANDKHDDLYTERHQPVYCGLCDTSVMLCSWKAHTETKKHTKRRRIREIELEYM